MSEAPAGSCVLCGKAVEGEPILVNGKRTCAACRDALLAELARESESGNLMRPVAAGLAAAAACGALWAALTVLTSREIGFAAVGVGWAVAHAVRLASGGRRGPALQKAAVACSVLGLLLGKLFGVVYAVHDMTEHAPDRPPDFHLSYADPRVLKFAVLILPRTLTVYDALWIFLALSAAWRVLKPARVVLAHARGNASPAA